MKKSKQAGKYILSDFISASVAWLLFNILRYEVFAIDEGADSLLDYLQYPGVLGGQVVIPLFWLVLYYFSGYYNKPFGKSRLTELFSTFITVLIGTVFVFFALLLDDIPRSIDIYYKLFFGMFGLQFFITYIPRLLITQSGMRKIKNREWAMKVLIIGAGGKAVRIAHDLYRLGYDICGFVSEDERTPVKADRNQVLGTVEDIPVLMEKENVDEIVLAVESKNNKALLGILYSLYRYKRPIKVLADRFNMLSKIQLRTIRGIPLVDVTDNNFLPAEQNIKLFLDKVCSVVALLLLSPLFAYIAWRVKKDSPGPVFFRQERIGYLGHDPELFFDSVENNILLGDKKEADDYLKAVCMEQETAEMEDGKQTAVGNGGVRLSGGQAKRLALARTLCHKKPVLILDDPFSALDKNTEKQIFANLKQQTKDNIVFLISHRLYLFQQMDQVIWMEDGKAVAGTHEEILEKIPEYRSLYETQSDERENAKVETENRKTVSEHTEERRSGR